MKAIYHLIAASCLILFAGCEQEPKAPATPQQPQQQQPPKDSPSPAQ